MLKDTKYHIISKLDSIKYYWFDHSLFLPGPREDTEKNMRIFLILEVFRIRADKIANKSTFWDKNGVIWYMKASLIIRNN